MRAYSNLPQAMKDLEKKGILVSIEARDLDSGKILYAVNENLTLNPASNVKLFTSAAALEILGSQFIFQTKVFHYGSIQDQKLKGNLYVQGFGDPLFVSERLWFLINDLAREGFKTITGDLILDPSYFDTNQDIEFATGDDNQRAYSAPLSALSLNFNVVAIYVRPGHPNKKPLVFLDPENEYVEVLNEATTGAKDTLQVDRFQKKDKMVLKVSGVFPKNVHEKRIYRNVLDPVQYYGAVFKEFLKQRGIILKGDVKMGKVPDSAHSLTTYDSKFLKEILSGLNLYSNNFIAEQIVKTLGAFKKQAPGTTSKGIDVIKLFLEENLKFKNGSFVIKNGSGFSKLNRFSSHHFVELLHYSYKKFEIAPEFISSLGVPHEDSTLARYQSLGKQYYLRAKTGSLTGVVALSGYLKSRHKKNIAFSILLNSSSNNNDILFTNIQKVLSYLSQI